MSYYCQFHRKGRYFKESQKGKWNKNKMNYSEGSFWFSYFSMFFPLSYHQSVFAKLPAPNGDLWTHRCPYLAFSKAANRCISPLLLSLCFLSQQLYFISPFIYLFIFPEPCPTSHLSLDHLKEVALVWVSQMHFTWPHSWDRFLFPMASSVTHAGSPAASCPPAANVHQFPSP